MVGFDRIKIKYLSFLDFGIIFHDVSNNQYRDHIEFHLHDVFLFHGSCLCIYCLTLRLLVWELHVASLVGHFGRDRMTTLVIDRFYWPTIQQDVTRIVS